MIVSTQYNTNCPQSNETRVKRIGASRGLMPVMASVSTVLLALAIMLPISLAEAVLQPGEEAPSFDLKDSAGNVYHLDKKSSDVVLLVFVRTRDNNTSAALLALNNMFEKLPMLEEGLRRWIIISGVDAAREVTPIAAIAGRRWHILLDAEDAAYRAYKIIAAPTVVIVGRNRKVEAINPGYDLGMEDHVRRALAQALSVSLPEAIVKQPEKPNMTLQMGRRLAARGLWDDALQYYTRAMEQEPLSAEAQLELARIYVELQRADDAVKILNQIPKDSPAAAHVAPLLERARALKENRLETLNPPKVTR
jgi:tetratricopeptide (TPR) repeat protein